MAHEVETMAYANALPWHGLGQRVDSCVTTDEMLKAAGLGWTVEMKKMHIDIDGEQIPVPGKRALVRSSDNSVLTIAGDNWKPRQNAEMLEMLRAYVEAGGAKLETAGSLRNGRLVWALINLTHTFQVGSGDKVNGYILATLPHEVGLSHALRTTTVRVVCANTLAMAEGNSSLDYRQSHARVFDVDAAKAAIGNAHEELVICEKRFKTIAGLKLSVEDAVRKVIVPAMLRDMIDTPEFEDVMNPKNQPKSLRDIIDSINNAPGAEPGTGWGALNGVTHWTDHVASKGSDLRMYRSWIGDNSKLKSDVEKRIFELV